MLPSGEYDVTPEILPVGSARYRLNVFENGQAEYELRPSSSMPTLVTFLASKAIPRIGESTDQGYLVRIPQDTDILLLAVNLGPDLGLRLFELIYHSPGESPGINRY